MAPTESEERFAHELLSAAIDGKLQKLKKIVKNFVKVREARKECEKYRDETGRSALHWAAVGGSTLLCKYLIEKLKMNVDILDFQGRTPLILAILHNRRSTVEYLIEMGANVNRINKVGETALYCAMEDNIGSMELLISKGADVNATSAYGTPLQHAAEVARKRAVKILLDNNANANTGLRGSLSPLQFAVAAKSLDCVKLLLTGGADPNVGAYGYNLRPLCTAASLRQTEIVVHLLKNGADPNAVDVFGSTPLEEATRSVDFKGALELLPHTTRLPWITEWTLKGVVAHVHSKESIDQRQLIKKAVIQDIKSKGENALKAKNYWIAVNWFCLANQIDPKDATIHSDLSFCWACLDSCGNALTEAQECVRLSPQWPTAHLREGQAWKLYRNYRQAATAFQRALSIERDNDDIKKELRDAVEAEQSGDADGLILMTRDSSNVVEMIRSRLLEKLNCSNESLNGSS